MQALYAQKLEEGLSSTTVRHIHSTIHRALHQAVRWGALAYNIADLVDPPRRAHHEMETLTRQQVKSFLRCAKGERLEALYSLALNTGMRQGELLALRWKDVDLEGGKLQVMATLQRVTVKNGALKANNPEEATGGKSEDNSAEHTTKLVFSEPKTGKSRRQIALTPFAVASLRAHRARQAEERLALGADWEDNELVFPNAVGRPMEASNLLKRSYKPLLEAAGLPDMPFHSLRHSTATLLLSKNVNSKVVSEMLGHSKVGITLDIYAHVTPDMQREAVDAMESLMAG